MVRLECWSEKTEETKFFIRAGKRQNNALLKTIYQEGQPFLSINKSPGTFQNWGDFMQLRRIRIALFRSWSEPRCDLLNICIWSFFMLEERKKERKSMPKLPRKLSKICIQVWIFKKMIWTETKRHGFSTLHGIQSPSGKMLLHQSENWNKMNSYNDWNTTLFTVVSLFRCWVSRWAQSWTNWRQTPWWRKYA